MAASEIPDQDWESQAEIDACLAETGVSIEQVRRWRREGLLPDVLQLPATYNGSAVLYPLGTCAQIRAAQKLFAVKSRVDYVGPHLWLQGFPVDERHWRPRLERFAKTAARVLPLLRWLTARYDGDPHNETFQDKAAQHFPNNIVLSRIKARLNNEELAIFVRVINELTIGQFEQFDYPAGNDSRSRDESITIKALDLGHSETYDIFGAKFRSIEAIPFLFGKIASELSEENFAQAARAPDAEIAQARDDTLNALAIGASLYEAMRWVYGDRAFGLRLVAWIARKAPVSVIFSLIPGMLLLRRIPSVILPSDDIKYLAEQAKLGFRLSKQVEYLWKNDPRFAEVFHPKRIKTAFSDRLRYKFFLEEIRAASMTPLDKP